jgi:hypothetical protein
MLNQFNEGELKLWHPATYERNPAIEANTHFFIMANHAATADIVDFGLFINPKGQWVAHVHSQKTCKYQGSCAVAHHIPGHVQHL